MLIRFAVATAIGMVALAGCSAGVQDSPGSQSPSGSPDSPSTSAPEIDSRLAEESAPSILADQKSVKEAAADSALAWTVDNTQLRQPLSKFDNTERSVLPADCTILSQVASGLAPNVVTTQGNVTSVVLLAGGERESNYVLQYLVTGTEGEQVGASVAEALGTCTDYVGKTPTGTTIGDTVLVNTSNVTISNPDPSTNRNSWNTQGQFVGQDCDRNPDYDNNCQYEYGFTGAEIVSSFGDVYLVTSTTGNTVPYASAIHQQAVDRLIEKASGQ